jgi:hypothetical protein
MGKRLDLMEKLIGQMLVEAGPRKFMIAVNNATAHGGALLENPRVGLDNQDLMLGSWHELVEGMIVVGKWMEGDDTLTAEFLEKRMEEKRRGLKPRLADRLEDSRGIGDMREVDRSKLHAATLADMLFDMTGERVRVRGRSAKAKNITLRGPLHVVVDHIRQAMNSDQPFTEALAEIALAIADSHTTLEWEGHEYFCNEDYGRIVIESPDQPVEPENLGHAWHISESDLEQIIQSELGVATIVNERDIEEESDAESDPIYVFRNFTEIGFREFLRALVENQRTAEHAEDALQDMLGLNVDILISDHLVVAGPDFPDGLTKREARTMRRKKK